MTSTAIAPTLVLGASSRATVIAREVALVAAGVAAIALAAQVVVPLPFTPVPLTGQTFAFLLVGGAYGAARGGVTALAYLLVGFAGAPLFAGGVSGWGVMTSATAGYLVGMALAAVLVGAAADRRWDRRLATSLPAMLLGSATIYLLGAGWLGFSLHLGAGEAVAMGVTPFLVGDALKLLLAGAVLPAAWKGIRALSGR